MSRGRTALTNLLVVGCGGVLVAGMLLGWITSGEVTRNSFGLMRIPSQLGLDGFAGVRVLWFSVPVVVGGAVAFAILGRRLPATGASLLASVIVVPVAAGVLLSDRVTTGNGPVTTILGSLALVVAVQFAQPSGPVPTRQRKSGLLNQHRE